MSKARYVMIGGFLGAGKTTAILQIAKRLRDQGKHVGLITNDQSFGLVDTTMLASHGFAVEEITGGCFCCRFNSLVEASDKLTTAERPDVFIAEPVGSCTDLKATVDYPLRRMYGEDFAIAPFSVMLDPVRALRILGLEEGKSFSAKVSYIYNKQLEEAELIVVNKTDLLTPQRLSTLTGELARQFPKARVLAISARGGTGIDAWMEGLNDAPLLAGAMSVDYDTYAEGEALLGWLNATVAVSSKAPFDGNDRLRELAALLQERLSAAGAEVAHLKMTLSPEEGNDLAVLNLVRNDHIPELSHRLQDDIEAGELIVNLRAEHDPQALRALVSETLGNWSAKGGLALSIEHMESFPAWAADAGASDYGRVNRARRGML